MSCSGPKMRTELLGERVEVRLEESQEGGSSELDLEKILGRSWAGRQVTGKIFSIGKTLYSGGQRKWSFAPGQEGRKSKGPGPTTEI